MFPYQSNRWGIPSRWLTHQEAACKHHCPGTDISYSHKANLLKRFHSSHERIDRNYHQQCCADRCTDQFQNRRSRRVCCSHKGYKAWMDLRWPGYDDNRVRKTRRTGRRILRGTDIVRSIWQGFQLHLDGPFGAQNRQGTLHRHPNSWRGFLWPSNCSRWTWIDEKIDSAARSSRDAREDGIGILANFHRALLGLERRWGAKSWCRHPLGWCHFVTDLVHAGLLVAA